MPLYVVGYLILIVAGFLLVAGVLYWLLVSTEGVFLGRRMVIWLYELSAARYDQIKEFDPRDERLLVTNPVLSVIPQAVPVRLLDVATGTGRVPNDLLQAEDFSGTILALDASWAMLQQATRKLGNTGRLAFLQSLAAPLPFRANAFDIVSCLEALEFFPSDEAAVAEMVRVLRPGGTLFITRRCGREGKLFLHRYRSEREFVALLEKAGLSNVRAYHWEVGYDLLLARKS